MDGLKNQDDESVPTKDDHMLIGGSDSDGSSSYHAGGTKGEGDDSDFHTGHASLLKRLLGGHYYTLRLRLGMPDSSAKPTPATGRTVTRCTLLLFFTSFLLWSTVIFGFEQGTGAGAVFSGLMATLMAGSLAKLVILIIQQPESTRRLPYMAPCVPFVPAAAILVNSYLMLKLSALTWARFTIWCLIGELKIRTSFLLFTIEEHMVVQFTKREMICFLVVVNSVTHSFFLISPVRFKEGTLHFLVFFALMCWNFLWYKTSVSLKAQSLSSKKVILFLRTSFSQTLDVWMYGWKDDVEGGWIGGAADGWMD